MSSAVGSRVERTIAAVSFDVTGTLLHSPRMAQVYAKVFERHGYAVGVEHFEHWLPIVWQDFESAHLSGANRFGEGAKEAEAFWQRVVARVCAYLELPPPSPFLLKELYRAFEQSDSWELYPDVVTTLEELSRKGLRLLVLSNWDERLPRLLSAVGLDHYFEHIIYSQQVGVEKPHRDLFEHARGLLELPGGRVLHVGDRQREDFEGAQGAGWVAALVDRQRGVDLRASVAGALGE